MMVAGCAALPSNLTTTVETRVAVEPRPKLASAQLLDYLLEVRGMQARDLATEKDIVRAEFMRGKSEFSRMKLAMLLAVSPSTTASTEDAELVSLLAPLTYGMATTHTATDLMALATLMQSFVQDRKKLREQLKDSQARTQTTRRDEVNSLTEARILRSKVEELENQLAALKSIERSVSVKGEARTISPPLPR